MLKCKNTKKQGDVGLGAAIGFFSSKEFTVLLPLTDSQDYDLVIEENGLLKKVQIKTTRYKDKYGRYCFSLDTKGGNQSYNYIKVFNPSKIDYLFLLTEDNQKYLFPVSEITFKRGTSLGDKHKKYLV